MNIKKLKTCFATMIIAGLVLSLFQFILNRSQARLIIHYTNNEYGLKAVKSKIYLIFHNTSLEVSNVVASAVGLMLIVGAIGLGWLIWKQKASRIEKAEYDRSK